MDSPTPIDTGAVSLDEAILGPTRDDSAKTHPCLVPYDQLPKSEKQYDRAVATETLKAILALGYRIETA